jgi:hypothetical protein
MRKLYRGPLHLDGALTVDGVLTADSLSLGTAYPTPIVLAYDNAALTSTTTAGLYVVPAGKSLTVTSVRYYSSSGLAAHASDSFAITLQARGEDTVATHSTASGAQGTLTADAFATLTVVSAESTLAAGEVLRAVFTETGTATLPAGRLLVHATLSDA